MTQHEVGGLVPPIRKAYRDAEDYMTARYGAGVLRPNGSDPVVNDTGVPEPVLSREAMESIQRGLDEAARGETRRMDYVTCDSDFYCSQDECTESQPETLARLRGEGKMDATLADCGGPTAVDCSAKYDADATRRASIGYAIDRYGSVEGHWPYKTGGYIPGYKATEDKVPAMLDNGYVIPKQAADKMMQGYSELADDPERNENLPKRAPKCYIAGGISEHEDRNLPAFNATEEYLSGLGFDAYNPCRKFEEGWTHAMYMRFDLPKLIESDAIFMMAGWGTSEGARTEYLVAKACGLLVIEDPR